MKANSEPGAAEVGLHFVEDEEDVVLAAEALEQLQVFLLRMERTAAAEVRLGDQAADAAAEFVPQRFEFCFVRRQVERLLRRVER